MLVIPRFVVDLFMPNTTHARQHSPSNNNLINLWLYHREGVRKKKMSSRLEREILLFVIEMMKKFTYINNTIYVISDMQRN